MSEYAENIAGWRAENAVGWLESVARDMQFRDTAYRLSTVNLLGKHMLKVAAVIRELICSRDYYMRRTAELQADCFAYKNKIKELEHELAALNREQQSPRYRFPSPPPPPRMDVLAPADPITDPPGTAGWPYPPPPTTPAPLESDVFFHISQKIVDEPTQVEEPEDPRGEAVANAIEKWGG